jgi:hypothetical protein
MCVGGVRAIDFGSIHAYNNEWSNPPCTSACPFVYHVQDADVNWFVANNVPYVVGELGFSGAFRNATQCWHRTAYPGGNWWDGTPIPPVTTDRGPALQLTLNRFFDQYGADGVLQWAFMAGTVDNGSGDKCSGLSDGPVNNDWGFLDWSSLIQVYRNKAQTFP